MTTDMAAFDIELIKRYDKAGPRYTSYPTAAAFTNAFGSTQYEQALDASNEFLVPGPLSLYVHIPFCDTVCFYCACNKVATKRRELANPYIDALLKEADMLASHLDADREVSQLHLGGGTPNFLTTLQIERLIQGLQKAFPFAGGPDREMSIELDPRSCDEDYIQHLAHLGFNRFSLGVQDIDPDVQVAINRVQPLEQTQSVIEACRLAGARSISIDLIYGLPQQTSEKFQRTLDAAVELGPDRLSVFNYAHLPSRFAPQRRIKESELPSGGDKLNMLSQAVKTLTGAGYDYIGMDHFSKPDDELASARSDGSLTRNFQGYSVSKATDLVGLGCSAISSVGMVYGQNYKSLEAYYTAIAKNRLPIERGVSLDGDDNLRRHIITTLACEFSLDIETLEKSWEIDFSEYFYQELVALQQLANDGLIEIDKKHLQVTDKGRFLIRVVCMAFDVYLREPTHQAGYSKVI